MRKLFVVLLAGLAWAGPAAAAEVAAEIKVFQYAPKEIKIKVGDTVTWVNQDDIAHTVTAGKPGKKSGAFDSGDMKKGDSFSQTFDQEAMHDLFCTKHPSMKAHISVEK